MDKPITIDDARLFSVFAGDDVEKWKLLIGRRVNNRHYGWGTVQSILDRTNLPQLVRIEFDCNPGQTSMYSTEDVANPEMFLEIKFEGITGISEFLKDLEERRRAAVELHRQVMLAEQERQRQTLIAEQERQRQAQIAEKKRLEQAARQQEKLKRIQDLAATYHIPNYSNIQHDEYIWMVLYQIEVEEYLSNEDETLLNRLGLNGPLAVYYERCYERTQHPWDFVNCCKYWRHAENPVRALELSYAQNGEGWPPREKSALLTTRGGSLRDLGQLDEAMDCAKRALAICPDSYQPHNLLGAIHYQQGEFALGDQAFANAIERHGSFKAQDGAIRSIFRTAADSTKVAVAQHLLKKDPIRFRWVRAYLEELPWQIDPPYVRW